MTTTGLGMPTTAAPLPPTAGAVAPAAASTDMSTLIATLSTLLQALVAQQQLALGGGANGAVAGAATGSATMGGGPNAPYVDPGFSAGGSNSRGYTVEGSPWGNGNINNPQPTAAVAASTVAGGGPAPATTGPAGATVPTINPDHLLGTPTPGGVIDTIIKSASPHAMEAMSEGDWITLTDGSAQMHVHTHGVYLQQPNLIQGAIQSGKLQVHLHADGTAHLHDVTAA